MAKQAVKKAKRVAPKPAPSVAPTVCTCSRLAEPHYHLPEGAIVVWDPTSAEP